MTGSERDVHVEERADRILSDDRAAAAYAAFVEAQRQRVAIITGGSQGIGAGLVAGLPPARLGGGGQRAHDQAGRRIRTC
jgi:hypothetical protein